VSFDPAVFVDEFRAEAAEHLRKLDQQVLALERDPDDPQPIRQMFLSAHTIKGGAAMLELTGVRELAHALEDVLAQLRDTSRRLDATTADLLLRAVDALRGLVDRATPRAELEPSTAELARALRLRAGELSAVPARPAVPDPPRALVVDDSATVRLLETMVLTEVGFQVDAVGDGQQALELLRATAYRLMVAGLQNRGVDGLALLLAARDEGVPVILTSSNDDPEPRRQAAELGAYAFLAKGSLDDRRLAATAGDVLHGSGA
jgi:chemotaxis protein histidine kinase CheA